MNIFDTHKSHRTLILNFVLEMKEPLSHENYIDSSFLTSVLNTVLLSDGFYSFSR